MDDVFILLNQVSSSESSYAESIVSIGSSSPASQHHDSMNDSDDLDFDISSFESSDESALQLSLPLLPEEEDMGEPVPNHPGVNGDDSSGDILSVYSLNVPDPIEEPATTQSNRTSGTELHFKPSI